MNTNPFNILLHSPAFWTAILSAVGLVLLEYLGFPEDLWNAVLGVLIVVVGVFTANEAAVAQARATVIGMREMMHKQLQISGQATKLSFLEDDDNSKEVG